MRSHLRQIVAMDTSTGTIDSRTLSEPALADAAFHCLFDHLKALGRALQRFKNEIIKIGIIDKGKMGELLGRVVFLVTLFRQCRNPAQESSAQQTARTGNTPKGTECKESEHCDFASPKLFLSFLLNMLHSKSLENALKTCATSGNITIRDRIEGVFMNFFYFSRTDRPLSVAEKQITARDAELQNTELLHMLLHSGAALQLSDMQQDFDMLLPLYEGNPRELTDWGKIIPLFVQLKNRQSGRAAWQDITPEKVRLYTG